MTPEVEIAERVRPCAVARMTSLSIRKVQELSAAGKIPSAAKLGGVWTYDPIIVRRWIKQSEQTSWRLQSDQPPSTNVAKRGGDAAKLPESSIDQRYEQVIGAKRPRGTRRGG